MVSAEIGVKVMSAASIGVESKFNGFKDYDHIGRLSLLVEFYVPELLEDIEYIKKQFSSLSESAMKYYMRENNSHSENVVTTVEINETCKVIAKTISNAKSKLASVAKEVQKNV